VQRYQDSIILSTGQAVVGASVQVLTYPAGAVATIYSDNGSTTTTNPLITDGNGHFAFYAADARYSLVITKVGIAPITVSDILLEDPADGSAALSASGGAALVGFLPSGTPPTYGWATRTSAAKMGDVLSVKDGKNQSGTTVAGDGVQDDTTGIQAMCTKADAIGAELVFPPGAYKITADVTSCNKVRFEGATLTGNFQWIYQQQKNGWINGLNAYKLLISGAWRCSIRDPKLQNLSIDGFNSGWGTFNTSIWNGEVSVLTNLSMTKGPVNFNQFFGGIHQKTTLTGDHSLYAGALTSMIDNVWVGVDLEGGGIQQSDADMNGQLLISCWVEGTAPGTVVGNFQILGYRASGEAAYAQIGRKYHLLGSTEAGQTGSAHGDFVSANPELNAAQGGSWDNLDSSSKPVCMAQFGGWAPTVNTDTTEPTGRIGKTYGGACSTTFAGIAITIQPCGILTNPTGVLQVLYKGTADFTTAEVNNGGSLTYPVQNVTVIDSVNNWKILRVSFIARTLLTTIVNLYFNSAGSGPTTINIGAVRATGERACFFPGASDVTNNNGLVTVKGAVVGVTTTGTWTPSIGGNATYTVQDGSYLKNDKWVEARCSITINVLGTGSNAVLSGLPFTSMTTASGNPAGGGQVLYFATLATNVVSIVPYVASNGTTISFSTLTVAAGTAATGNAIFQNGTRVDLVVLYQSAT
jgi:hypothetical protein